MKSVFDIMKEPDPILREIWAFGYDEVIQENCTRTLSLLMRDKGYVKTIPLNDLQPYNFSIMGGILPDGKRHYWIKEGDGSCERLRNIIKPDLP